MERVQVGRTAIEEQDGRVGTFAQAGRIVLVVEPQAAHVALLHEAHLLLGPRQQRVHRREGLHRAAVGLWQNVADVAPVLIDGCGAAQLA